MMPRCLLCIGASGCFVGFPPLQEPWLDTAAPLRSPECATHSLEPDDGTADGRFSALGLLTEEPRTLCGETDRDDVDYALFQLLERGEVHFDLEWDGSGELELLGDDQELEAGFYSVGVAHTEGRSTEYALTAWVED
jgi:hypothetical protein